MEQEKIDKINSAITDIRQKLIQVVGTNAMNYGFSKEEIHELLDIIQPEFFKSWFAGVPDDEALIGAIQKADRIVSRSAIEKAVANGESPEAAFERIKTIKLAAAGGDENAAAMAENASAAFSEALAGGAAAGDALESAFDSAAA